MDLSIKNFGSIEEVKNVIQDTNEKAMAHFVYYKDKADFEGIDKTIMADYMDTMME